MNLGRGEMRAGRSLDALLAAYRLGARVAWRRLAAAGEAAGLEPRTLYLLAESIFAYIDELSGESIEGYAMEQAAAAGELQRLRRATRRPAGPGPARRRGGDGGRGAGRRLGAARPSSPRSWPRATSPTGWRCGSAPTRSRSGLRRASARSCRTPTRPAGAAQLEAAFDGRLGSDRPHGAVAAGRRERRPGARHPRPGAGGGDRGRTTACSTAGGPLARAAAQRGPPPRARHRDGARSRRSTARLRPRGSGSRETLLAWLRHRGRTEQRRRGAARPPADRALPAGPPARALRRAARGSRRPLRARAGASLACGARAKVGSRTCPAPSTDAVLRSPARRRESARRPRSRWRAPEPPSRWARAARTASRRWRSGSSGEGGRAVADRGRTSADEAAATRLRRAGALRARRASRAGQQRRRDAARPGRGRRHRRVAPDGRGQRARPPLLHPRRAAADARGRGRAHRQRLLRRRAHTPRPAPRSTTSPSSA